MYVKDGTTILADSLRMLGRILSRPVVSFAFRPLKVDATLSTGIGENLNCAHRNELILSLVVRAILHDSSYSAANVGPILTRLRSTLRKILKARTVRVKYFN